MNRYPHRIRLRGPWECQFEGGSHRLHTPCNREQAGLPAGFTGQARFLRSFGYPGNIDADEHVWLTLSGVAGQTAVFLNGNALGSGRGDFEFDATSILGKRNRLEMLMEITSSQTELWSDVAMEIRCAAFLKDMQAVKGGDEIRIEGRVAGSSDDALELYVLLDRKNAAYQTIKAGDTFAIEVAVLPETEQKVRVELVNLSTVWYAWETTVASGS